MKKCFVTVIVIIVFLAMVGISKAGLINGGFETGDFTGWEVTIANATDNPDSPWWLPPMGSASIVPTYTGPFAIPITPTLPFEGQFFAVIATTDVNLSGGGIVASARQSVYLNEGDLLSGWVAFYNGDYKAWDHGRIRIYDAADEIIATPFYATSGQQSPIPLYEVSPWTNWQWIAPTASVYSIELAAILAGPDNQFTSAMLIDNIHVPEPNTILLLGLGLMGIAGAKRKFSK